MVRITKLAQAGIAVPLFLILLVTIAGGALGQPAGLVFVETGSMSPELEPGSGYIAMPTAITGPPEQGDVILFDAVNINDGELVTHRVEAETEAGYITKGDNNPFTDQDSDEPPVQEAQIQAKALAVGGDVVDIPSLGVVVTSTNSIVEGLQQQLAIVLGTRLVLGTQGMAYILLGFGILSYTVSILAERSNTSGQSRQVKRETGLLSSRNVIVSLTVILVVVLSASMLLPSGTYSFQFVSSQSDAPGSDIIGVGETENTTFEIPSNGAMPVVAIIEPSSGNVTINQSVVFVPSGETKRVIVSLNAPSETGSYTQSISERRYLAFLPTPTIHLLYTVHPWLPIVAINSVMGLLFAGFAVLIVGIDPIRVGRRADHVPILVRIRRWLR